MRVSGVRSFAPDKIWSVIVNFMRFRVARGVPSTSAPFCVSRGRALIGVHLKTVIIWPYFFFLHFFQCTVTYMRWTMTIPCSLLFFFFGKKAGDLFIYFVRGPSDWNEALLLLLLLQGFQPRSFHLQRRDGRATNLHSYCLILITSEQFTLSAPLQEHLCCWWSLLALLGLVYLRCLAAYNIMFHRCMCLNLFKGTFRAGRTHWWISHALGRQLGSCVCTIRTLVTAYLFFPPSICQVCSQERCTSGATAAGGKMPWIVVRLSVPGGLTETETVLSGSCGSVKHNRWEAKNFTLLKKKEKKERKMGAPVTIPPPGLIFISAHKRLHQFTLAADFPLSWWRRDGPLCVYTQREGEPGYRFSHPCKTLWAVCKIQGGAGVQGSPPPV